MLGISPASTTGVTNDLAWKGPVLDRRVCDDGQSCVNAGPAKNGVDTEFNPRLYAAKLRGRVDAHYLQIGARSEVMNSIRQCTEIFPGQAHVLEADVVQLAGANVVQDRVRVGDGSIVLGQHEHEVGHVCLLKKCSNERASNGGRSDDLGVIAGWKVRGYS